MQTACWSSLCRSSTSLASCPALQLAALRVLHIAAVCSRAAPRVQDEYTLAKGQIRWGYVAKKLGAVAAALNAIGALGVQLVLPDAAAATPAFAALFAPTCAPSWSGSAAAAVAARYAAIIPSVYASFLCVFAVLFLAALPLLAELTRYPDRLFFGAWWSARSARHFWARWNALVHAWCKRSVLALARSKGAPPLRARVRASTALAAVRRDRCQLCVCGGRPSEPASGPETFVRNTQLLLEASRSRLRRGRVPGVSPALPM
jgi:MBOAT, membrane-bound O-acyltransferase family